MSNVKDHAGTHDENRGKICLFCLKKQGRNGKSVIVKIIKNGKIEPLVQLIFDYDADDKCLPNGVCKTCLHKLYTSKEKNERLLEAPKVSFNYKSIETRQCEKELSCNCLICQLARKQPINIAKKAESKLLSKLTDSQVKGK